MSTSHLATPMTSWKPPCFIMFPNVHPSLTIYIYSIHKPWILGYPLGFSQPFGRNPRWNRRTMASSLPLDTGWCMASVDAFYKSSTATETKQYRTYQKKDIEGMFFSRYCRYTVGIWVIYIYTYIYVCMITHITRLCRIQVRFPWWQFDDVAPWPG